MRSIFNYERARCVFYCIWMPNKFARTSKLHNTEKMNWKTVIDLKLDFPSGTIVLWNSEGKRSVSNLIPWNQHKHVNRWKFAGWSGEKHGALANWLGSRLLLYQRPSSHITCWSPFRSHTSHNCDIPRNWKEQSIFSSLFSLLEVGIRRVSQYNTSIFSDNFFNRWKEKKLEGSLCAWRGVPNVIRLSTWLKLQLMGNNKNIVRYNRQLGNVGFWFRIYRTTKNAL